MFRAWCWTFALLVIGQVLSAGIVRANDRQLRDAILPLIEKHQGEVAVAVQHLEKDILFQHCADEVMPTASLIKLPLMIATYHAATGGELDLAKPVVLKNEDKVPGSGILTEHFSAGVTLPLRDYVRLMIRDSDNTATNVVIDQVGLAATAELMDNLGLTNTKLHSKVYRGDTSIFPERSKQFGIGSTTANEMVRLLRMLKEQKLGDATSTQQMLDHLAACDDRTKIARYVPSGMKFFHKTGAISNCRTDAGIIETATGPVAVCVLTNKNSDQSWTDNNKAEILCAEIGRVVVTRFGGDASSDKTRSFSKTLQRGSSGWLVEGLQRTLNARLAPSAGLVVDGEFGPATESAVKRFQETHELQPSGVVDVMTWKLLGPLVSESQPRTPQDKDTNGMDQLKQPAPALNDPPIVTCQAWVVADAASGNQLHGWNIHKHRPPASTTKIMTALLVAELIANDPKVADEMITFSQFADDTIGSSCGLSAGEQLPVSDLLYGLLLPSGNDAAAAIAEHFGVRFQQNLAESFERPYEAFVAKMNIRATELGMKDTRFANPHGLTEAEHWSTAGDLARLAFAASKNELLMKIVGTRQHACQTSSVQGFSRLVEWRNTNRLLEIEGFSGMKTGTTEAAGACLVSLGSRGGQSRIVVVLGSSDSQARYADTRNLFRWSLAMPSSLAEGAE